MIESIVHAINETLRREVFAGVSKLNLFGISSLVHKKKEGKLITLPAIAQAGEFIYPSPDDGSTLIAYHTIAGRTYENSPVKGYGDQRLVKDIAEMQMIVYANLREIGRSAVQLQEAVAAAMPQTLIVQVAGTNVQAHVSLRGAELDSLKVFRQQYPQTDFFLAPEDGFFSLRYRITAEYDQRCLRCCL